jgi:hypothetical protein
MKLKQTVVALGAWVLASAGVVHAGDANTPQRAPGAQTPSATQAGEALDVHLLPKPTKLNQRPTLLV